MTLVSGAEMRDKGARREAEVILGEDWTAPQAAVDRAARAENGPRQWMGFTRSPLARKVITFNLIALVVLVAGILFLNPFRSSLVHMRETGLATQAQLVANVVEARLPAGTTAGLAADGTDPAAMLAALNLDPDVQAYLFDPSGRLVATTEGRKRTAPMPVHGLPNENDRTFITGFLNAVWARMSRLFDVQQAPPQVHAPEQALSGLVPGALAGAVQVREMPSGSNGTVYSVAAPVMRNGTPVGVLALASGAGQIERLVSIEREQVLQMFVIAMLVSIGLSVLLASTIANPLADLAAAAEVGRDKSLRTATPSRVRIPDLSGRPDEIGRLSRALRGMVTALYDRIDANEQFAADVAHEIKNPLASLRSAVGTMRVAKRDDQREKLLQVIEHDVRRLDRLVSDISNASRLDSELVKEEEQAFDLLRMLSNLCEYLGNEARSKGVEFISDLPSDPIVIHGLEARLAQVFVNLITNATSFCEDGDAIRVWARRRENRVLVVVEDTGPGIPEQALAKIFKRFYSDRPPGHFGNNSGLGLAISKQIVEAHGGVIWAENIRPTDADRSSDPLGARFVVGLPI